MLFDDLVQHSIYHGQPVPFAARAYDYVLAGNGIFKRARSPHICAQINISPARIAGLPDLEPALQIAVFPGRIPGRLLYSVLVNAQVHAWLHREQMYQFAFSGPQSVRLVRPDQRAGGALVQYRADSGDGVICDLHSHHTMRAYFSYTDDTDEQGFRFYAVIGDVLSRPAMALRLGMYGDFLDLPATALFTDPGPFRDAYDTGDFYDDDRDS